MSHSIAQGYYSHVILLAVQFSQKDRVLSVASIGMFSHNCRTGFSSGTPLAKSLILNPPFHRNFNAPPPHTHTRKNMLEIFM